ncbi:MAG: hypothetical protein H6574_23830 [Lewinellaceae bacterium]|nr:hypothetical protein [Saprospiraceae bacterium]MCB9334095.1 hypothetical protein [Lewinellaceae bacterium]
MLQQAGRIIIAESRAKFRRQCIVQAGRMYWNRQQAGKGPVMAQSLLGKYF